MDPKTIALHAAQEFIVEDIISLEGTKNNKKRYNRTNLRVKVRWIHGNHIRNSKEMLNFLNIVKDMGYYTW